LSKDIIDKSVLVDKSANYLVKKWFSESILVKVFENLVPYKLLYGITKLRDIEKPFRSCL